MQKSFKQAYVDQRDKTAGRIRAYLQRRPHRSFRMSRRRDYVRNLVLPGYWRFTKEVRKLLWANRKLFFSLAIVYALLTIALVGLGSQESYANLTSTLRQTGSEVFTGQWGKIGEAGLLFASVATSGLTGTASDVQQVYTLILLLFVWVTTVYLLRQVLAGRKVRLRDGLYNAGAPVIATLLITGLVLVQTIPLALATIGYSAASATGLIAGGIEAMLFWATAGLLTVLSMYWLVPSFFAMVIVTLPGTYPMYALRTAGDIVTGRRMKILLRMVWLLASLVVLWAVTLIPIILFDGAIKAVWPAIESAPIVPIALLAISTISVIWAATYVYMLYRKVVEYDAAE